MKTLLDDFDVPGSKSSKFPVIPPLLLPLASSDPLKLLQVSPLELLPIPPNPLSPELLLSESSVEVSPSSIRPAELPSSLRVCIILDGSRPRFKFCSSNSSPSSELVEINK